MAGKKKRSSNKKKKKNNRMSVAQAAALAEQGKGKKKKKAKPARNVAAANNKKKRGGLLEYFKGVRLEMKKVVWPTKAELGSYTVVVIGVCAFFAIMFWAVDTGFLAGLKGILGINM